ncbi:MAG: hypothetical protein AABX14_05275 [Candidatus Aenigmatarchaeota archaeon]
MLVEEPGAAYREFLKEVKEINVPYLSNEWTIEYLAVLRRAKLPDFSKLPFLALPLSLDYIRV